MAGTRLSDEQLALLRTRLSERLQALRSEILDDMEKMGDQRFSELAGEVHDRQEEALASVLVDLGIFDTVRDADEVRDIEDALGRMARGAYGVCADCEEPIRYERLLVWPTAKRCRDCQVRHEAHRTRTPSM